ncbi:zinc finger protein 2-like [Topomyia yanbarensis]|uniref:zinc finger protein 2-like n=1 Tax=Topomyia yanbarensis TaxID=2498891 RepID=UPI00273B2A90|nr:zinc finger protein 2-like [Topomyia yanbarensis]
MAICRLCTKSCPSNDRLTERAFREKVLNVICLWMETSDESLPNDVCVSCDNLVDQFHAFKRSCRSVQLDFKNGSITIPRKPPELVPEEKKLTVTAEEIERRKKRGRPRKNRGDIQNSTIVKQSTPDTQEIPAESVKEDSPSRKPWFSLDEPMLPPEPKPKCPKKVYKLKPKPAIEGSREVVPRPWRRKFKEAAELPPEEYRQYVAQNSVRKKASAVCELCGKTMDIVRMDGHKNRHLGLQPYECETCGDKFNCKLNLRIHWRRNHVQGEETACTICGKIFPSKIAAHSHMKCVHAERKLQCTLCPLKFFTKYGF